MATTILGGLLSATLSLLHFIQIPGIIFFSYFSSLPLFLIGLGLGIRPLYIAGLLASAIVFFLEGPALGGEFFILSFLGPAFLVNRALLSRKKKTGEQSWYPASLLLRDLTLASGISMLIGLGAYLYFTQGGNIDTLIITFLKTFDPHGQMKQTESLLKILFPLIPGLFAFSWSFMMLINGSLAQGLLMRFNRNLRPSLTFSNLSVSNGFIILFGLSLLLSFIGVGSLELIGKNSAFVMTFPFFLVGLSLIHSWFYKTNYPTIGLTLFYFFLLLFFWPILIVILIGLLKPLLEKTIS